MAGPILSSQPQNMTTEQVMRACFDSTNNVLKVGISAESIDLDIEGPAAQDAAVTGNPVQISFESANFDGAALPDSVGAEGDIIRPKASLNGVPYFMPVNEDGSKTVISTDASAQVATPDILNIGGEYRAAETTYTDGNAFVLQGDVNGYTKVRSKAYDSGTTADKAYEVSPISTHHVEEATTTASLAAGTTFYVYLDMDGYRNFGIQFLKTLGAGTFVATVEATLRDDGTAVGSITEWVDVSSDWFGAANWTADDYLMSQDGVVAKYVRLKVVTAADTSTYAIYTKKLY